MRAYHASLEASIYRAYSHTAPLERAGIGHLLAIDIALRCGVQDIVADVDVMRLEEFRSSGAVCYLGVSTPCDSSDLWVIVSLSKGEDSPTIM